MELLLEMLQPLVPFLGIFTVLWVFAKLFSWAKNRKSGALAFGILVQMFIPDPYTERTVEIVQQDKKETKKQQDENGQGPSNKNEPSAKVDKK